MVYTPKDSELSHVHFDAVLVDVILDEIKKDVLPSEDIEVPEWELPANDQDGTVMGESIKEKDQKWNALCVDSMKLR